ncbi:MAG: hypothetical protein KF898_08630 [Parachlamydiales bacterium]|nr:hypothetical protein [Candidatus Acheromyda pituitae]
MHQVLIYADKGVDGGALKQLVRSLKHALGASPYELRRVDANILLTENWEESAALLIIPGGRDIFYHAALDGAGTERIRRYVENGGKYLGICAGAYFACKAIEFEKGGALEVCADRSLQFFPGIAKGPAYGPDKYSYENARGVEAAAVTWEDGTCPIYFNGGCLFDADELYPHVDTISRYIDLEGRPAAIVDIPIGQGRAILSGVHVEYSPLYLNAADPYLQKLIPIFEKAEGERRLLFRSLLARLGLHHFRENSMAQSSN